MAEKKLLVSSMVSAVDWLRSHGGEQGKSLVAQIAGGMEAVRREVVAPVLDATLTNSGTVLVGNVYDFLAQQQEKGGQPRLSAELAGLWRGGREDAFNNLIVAFPPGMSPTREPGAPGSPTSQLTTEALTGGGVDKQTDSLRRSILGYELPDQGKEPAKEQSREL